MSLSNSTSLNVLALNKRNIKLKQVVVTPEISKPKKPSQYWRLAFGIVSLPFFFMGFPVQLIFFGRRKFSKHDDSTKPPDRKLEWFKTIVCPRNIFFLCLILIHFGNLLTITSYPLRAIWGLFDELVIQGVITWNVLDNGLMLVQLVPATVPLIAIWFIGYSFRDFISSVENFRRNSVKRLTLIPRGRATFKHPTSFISFWLKLFFIYLIIVGIHLVPVMASGWESQHWTKVWIVLMYRMIPPVYCVCCWVLQSEFQILSGFLTANLKDKKHRMISPENFEEVKDLYRKATRHVTYVNKKIGKYMSFMVIPLITWPALGHIILTWLYLRGSIAKHTLFSFLRYISEMRIEEMIKMDESDLIRSILTHEFVAILGLLLVFITLLQAIGVSDESRFAHVLINEVIGDHTSPAVKKEDFYKQTRHLKMYMTMTREFDNPALMILSSIRWVPFFNYRLHSSKLRNPPIHRRFLNEVV